MMSRFRYAALAVCACVALLSGCSFSRSYYLSGEGKERPLLQQMFAGMHEARKNTEQRFIFMREIITLLRAAHSQQRLNLFLTDYVARHPKDPYDAYYLYVVAEDYVKQKAIPFAVHYLDRVVAGYPDLDIRGTSIDYLSLTQLTQMVADPNRQVAYYKELLTRFSTIVPKAPTYYHLAESYERLGEWSSEMQAYENFLSLPDTTVPGVPNARQSVAQLVDFYNYPNKNWAFSKLSDLVSAIRYAIDIRSVSLLSRYWAKVGFFARSWESERGLVDPQFLGDFDVFMNDTVYVSGKIDIDSNSQEAYLQTGGWSYRIPTWYFYFRKISFPEDPKVQAKWEWAGIYFGDKPFSHPGF
ncbi:MAG TPA: hypothetical protein VMV68_00120 [Spirochaetia bacterium]|nr:hypothetical protein [Spirochaetia bacterium]